MVDATVDVLLLAACAVLASAGPGIKTLPHLYPYGPGTGDSIVQVSDDASAEIELWRPFPYFAIDRFKTWVNTNGMISFIWDTGVLFGIPFAEECVIAPFAIDLDTTANDGRVYYRQTTNKRILWQATRDVRRSFPDSSTFTADWVLIASYHRVTYVGGNSTSPVATFQVVMVTDGVESYVMFNYGDVQFAKIPNDFEYAMIGLDKGDKYHYYILPYYDKPSAEDIELTTNVATYGRWAFRVDGDNVIPGGLQPEGVYDCGSNSPCMTANRRQSSFSYIDMTKYVKCGRYGRCWIRPCALGTVYKDSSTGCIWIWWYNIY